MIADKMDKITQKAVYEVKVGSPAHGEPFTAIPIGRKSELFGICKKRKEKKCPNTGIQNVAMKWRYVLNLHFCKDIVLLISLHF